MQCMCLGPGHIQVSDTEKALFWNPPLVTSLASIIVRHRTWASESEEDAKALRPTVSCFC